MDIKNTPFPSIKQVHNEKIGNKKPRQTLHNSNFGKILDQHIGKICELKFSKHANMRLNSRNIKLTNEQLNKINNGVVNAEKKGIKESLMLIDNIALIVNIENKTVITAIEQTNKEEQIFTNIDGAVFL